MRLASGVALALLAAASPSPAVEVPVMGPVQFLPELVPLGCTPGEDATARLRCASQRLAAMRTRLARQASGRGAPLTELGTPVWLDGYKPPSR